MASLPPPSPWTPLAEGWEELFPLRQPRLELALRLAGPGQACLDAGCATGSLLRGLVAQGRRAHGLDLDPTFLTVARSRAAGLGIRWHEAGLLDLGRAVAGHRFQLITCLGQTLPHLLSEAEWLDFFGQARTALEAGGHLVIQAVNDGGRAVGESRELPTLRFAGGTLERRRTMLSATLAQFETTFQPLEGSAVGSRLQHLRMGPERAAELLRQAGLEPAAALADEAGLPFQAAAAGWVLIARR